MKPILSAIDGIKKRFAEVDGEIEKIEKQKSDLLNELTELESSITIASAKRKVEIKTELGEAEKSLAWLQGHRNTLRIGYDSIKGTLSAPIEEQVAGIREENKIRVEEINDLCAQLVEKIKGIKKKNIEIRADIIDEIKQLEPYCVPGSLNLPRFIDNIRLHNIVSPTLDEHGISHDTINYIYSKINLQN